MIALYYFDLDGSLDYLYTVQSMVEAIQASRKVFMGIFI